jgi:acetyl esterase/lipase
MDYESQVLRYHSLPPLQFVCKHSLISHLSLPIAMESQEKQSPALSGRIKVTTKTRRTITTATIFKIMRLFGTLLARPGKKFPAGSPQLTAPSSTQKKCNICERKVKDVWVYDLTLKKQPPSKKIKPAKTHRIYYFVGGGWQAPPTPSHWKFLVALLQKLPNTIISLISYPLAPDSPAPIAFPVLLNMYHALLAESAGESEIVTLAGDSAGGNIVLCLVLEALHLDPSCQTPYSIMAICPSADMRREHPSLSGLERNDPILRIPFIKSTAKAWTGEWEFNDRRVSPIEADVSTLSTLGIKVDGLTAGYDLLGPDGVLFREKLEENGVEGEWLHWEKMMHCWPLASVYGVFPESKEGFKWIVEVLAKRGRDGDVDLKTNLSP